MHKHQAKRPYNGSQPSIASYFSPSTSAIYQESQQASIPQLPPTVQSSLINVGMRVRKSVPEGYKTGSYSAFSLFSESNSSAPSPSASKSMPRTRPRAGARELLPFSGILKVGGLGTQQWGIYNNSNTEQSWDPYHASSSEGEMEEDDIPVLSQGSSLGSPSGANKRRFFDDEDAETERFEGMGGSPSFSKRVLAVPRRRGHVGAAIGEKTQQENNGMMVFGAGAGVQVAGQDVDFEDADFLDYGPVAEKGVGEVEMSG